MGYVTATGNDAQRLRALSQPYSLRWWRSTRTPTCVTGRSVGRLSNKEIAELLHIRVSTVKFHLSNILAKLHVTSRHELTETPLKNYEGFSCKPIFTHLRMAVHRSNLRRHPSVFGALQAGNGRDRPVLAWRDRVLVEVALNSVSSFIDRELVAIREQQSRCSRKFVAVALI